MLKIVVTGVNGFVGGHLVREVKSRGHTVVGIGREDKPTAAIQKEADEYIACDLTNEADVAKLDMKDVDAIINLAGLANVGASFGAEELYKKVNVDVLAKLGERLLTLSSSARLVAISTGAVYDPYQPVPLTEKSKVITEGSPYAMSKLMMEDTAKDLRKRGLDCVTVRPFNHTGPGQAPGFLIPDLFQKLIKFKATGEAVKVGSLSTKRDYTDVRDIVKAYADLAVAETLEYDLYNICSGKSHAGQEVLDIMLDAMDLREKVKVEVDQSLIRPSDPPELYGSRQRLTEETGWEPEVPLGQTIKDFVAGPR
jgi:GDP-4-dehydro-6-deoxy-D-mannose reductase